MTPCSVRDDDEPAGRHSNTGTISGTAGGKRDLCRSQVPARVAARGAPWPMERRHPGPPDGGSHQPQTAGSVATAVAWMNAVPGQHPPQGIGRIAVSSRRHARSHARQATSAYPRSGTSVDRCFNSSKVHEQRLSPRSCISFFTDRPDLT